LLGVPTYDQRIPGGLDLEEWAVLRRVLALIKECAPHGTSAGEVFQVIETALMPNKSVSEKHCEPWAARWHTWKLLFHHYSNSQRCIRFCALASHPVELVSNVTHIS